MQGMAALKWLASLSPNSVIGCYKNLLTFPTGMHDDESDMAALMGMTVNQAHPAITSEPEPEDGRHPTGIATWMMTTTSRSGESYEPLDTAEQVVSNI
jgi:hypothetical protein